MAKWVGLFALMSYCFVSSFAHSILDSEGSKNYNKIALKQVNRLGPYIGLISVDTPEENAFFSTGLFKPDPFNPSLELSGRRYQVGSVYKKRVIYVQCGYGLINAAATTQQLVDLFEIAGIVHFGIAGNIDNSLSIGDVTIPKKFVHSGIWDWLNTNATADSDDIAGLDVKDYNEPEGGENLLGHIGFNYERLYSVSGEPNTPQHLVWAKVNQKWLSVASQLEGLELQQCVNSSFCLEKKPKLVVGLRGSSANIFVDNAAFRDFLFNTFKVSSADMESSAVVMTCLSNGYPVIVIRGLSNLAGSQEGQNTNDIYTSLAATNTALSVVRFLKSLSAESAYFE